MSPVSVTFRGPLFGGMAGVDVQQTTHAILDELVEAGEARLKDVLKPRPAPGVYLTEAQAQKGKASKGIYANSIHSEVSGLLGRIDDSGVVYGPWLEGTSSRNQSTRFKGYSSFRKTRDWLQKQAPRIVQAHVRKLVQRLGGG